MNSEAHWENVYKSKAADRVSWYRPHLEVSLRLIERAAGSVDASIVDAGGGESTLVDDLIARGYRNLTVVDLSQTALYETRRRLGSSAGRVQWIAGDITKVALPRHGFDVWHDRAVFHFLTSSEGRRAYVRAVQRSVRPGGYVIVSTFGPHGPVRCSGLDVARYDAEGLHGEFGEGFRLLDASEELHYTPWGTEQQFLYCYCVVAAPED